MAPLPLFFNIHTDDWGSHRTGDSSLATAVGGFLTDLWGSHRGGSTSATAAAAAVKRSVEHGQAAYWWAVDSFTAMPFWWSVLCVVDLLVLFVVVLYFCPRAFSQQEEQRLAVAGVENKDGEERDVLV